MQARPTDIVREEKHFMNTGSRYQRSALPEFFRIANRH
jgi:hypothetical protein